MFIVKRGKCRTKFVHFIAAALYAAAVPGSTLIIPKQKGGK